MSNCSHCKRFAPAKMLVDGVCLFCADGKLDSYSQLQEANIKLKAANSKMRMLLQRIHELIANDLDTTRVPGDLCLWTLQYETKEYKEHQPADEDDNDGG